MSTFLAALLLSAVASHPVISDDYARARSEAIERKVPVFVDVWAPW